MKLDLLNNYTDEFYAQYFPQYGRDWLWMYEKQARFSEGWPVEESQLAEFFDRILTSDVSKRLWKRERYRPREMLLKLIRTDPGYALLAFKDLYKEDKDITGRLDRFIFYADELLSHYRRVAKRSVESNHHQDYAIISLYLSLRYPDKYVYYRFDLLTALLEKLGSLHIPEQEEPERYFKLMRTVHTFLKRHDGYEVKHLARLEEGTSHVESLWLAVEFLEFVTGRGILNFE